MEMSANHAASKRPDPLGINLGNYRKRRKGNALYVRALNREYLAPLTREGISHARLGRAIGVTDGAVSKWKMGERQIPPPVRLLLRMMARQGIDAFLANACAPIKSGSDQAEPVK